ncbi:MAG: 3-hydroxy-3-methylglutaryl CoA reductase [Parachlamydiales bacterium]|nr:3-hydroxy-3-methylglutaryl CoA reductase [Parachlamydiales bacterium]
MSESYIFSKKYLNSLLSASSEEDLASQLAKKDTPLPPRVPGGTSMTEEAIAKRLQRTPLFGQEAEMLLDPQTLALKADYQKNIENFIGTVKVPVGLIGPLRVNGIHAQGDYYIPLATSESALVASYHRGSLLISEAGGCSCALLSEGVCRAPGFIFKTLADAGLFVKWCIDHFEHFKEAAHSTTNHGQLRNLKVNIDGNHVYLIFEYTTGDASGQNMVTFATEAVIQFILIHSPIKPVHHFIEANLSGDKKASTQSFHSVRGKKVTAEIRIPRPLIEKFLHTTPELMVQYWNISAVGGVLSGCIGTQGHYANGLAALYLACGQDVACVAESAIGVTRIELTDEDELYASVTLPNIMVGTVGGGTKLPSQQSCLKIMGLLGTGKARSFAEVCAALALAGELSIQGAICAHHFSRAHRRLAR